MQFAMMLIAAILPLLSLYVITKLFKDRLFPVLPNLPPGSLGWPLIGETLKFKSSGQPGRFVRERMVTHNPQVFKTSLLGQDMAVLCGPAGNKFLFSNENKMVKLWWPVSVKKIFKSSFINVTGDEAKRLKKMLMPFFDPDAVKSYIDRMDLVSQQHIRTHWEGKEEVKVFPTADLYTFEMVCRLLTSIEDPEHISKLFALANIMRGGAIGFSFNIAGTRFHRAMKAVDAMREDLRLVAKQRRSDLEKKIPSSSQDLLSQLLVTPDASGKFMSETEIVDNILMLLYNGYKSSTSVITNVMKYLAEWPQVYELVLRGFDCTYASGSTEQIVIAKSKKQGELLEWEDIQKMRYLWNVVSEVLRLWPPISGSFREAAVDFTYAGYNIPKGWKLYWSPGSTHMDPTFFSKPDDFDPSRFDGAAPAPHSYVPFGGGPRICPAKEYARAKILVFLHNIVKRFRWDSLIPDTNVAYVPLPSPSQGLPICLRPHQSSA